MTEPLISVVNEGDLKPLIEELQSSDFKSISGRFPKNGLEDRDEHVKIVTLPNGSEVCLKDCVVKPGVYPSAETLQHDINVLGLIFEGQDVRPVKVFGRVENVLLMESVDSLTPVFDFLVKNKGLIDKVHTMLVSMDGRIGQAKTSGDITCSNDPTVLYDYKSPDLPWEKKLEGIKLGKGKEHVFVESYDAEKEEIKLVVIDPVR